ncbi:hypothetical protein LguiB_005818 [Lonicera macranthoides]
MAGYVAIIKRLASSVTLGTKTSMPDLIAIGPPLKGTSKAAKQDNTFHHEKEGDSLVWDFHFFRSLHDREAEDAHSFAIRFSFFCQCTNPACLVVGPVHKLNTNDCRKRRPFKVLDLTVNVFADKCCFKCILHWTNVVSSKNSRPAASVKCPLCKEEDVDIIAHHIHGVIDSMRR